MTDNCLQFSPNVDCSMEISEISLCSDGLTTMVLEDQIEKVLLEDITIEEKVNKLAIKE